MAPAQDEVHCDTRGGDPEAPPWEDCTAPGEVGSAPRCLALKVLTQCPSVAHAVSSHAGREWGPQVSACVSCASVSLLNAPAGLCA